MYVVASYAYTGLCLLKPLSVVLCKFFYCVWEMKMFALCVVKALKVS